MTAAKTWRRYNVHRRAAQIAEWQRQHAVAHGSYLDECGECVACLAEDDADYKRRVDL